MSAIEAPALSEVLRFAFSAFPQKGTGRAIFLDRDGVINEPIVGGYVTSWTEFQFVPGIIETLAKLSELELPMIVVSNQAGVEKGILRASDLAYITRRFVACLVQGGARIDAVYYCPHAAEQECKCRKPREGLLRKAAAEWHLDLARSVFIGDSVTDMQAARAANCNAILLDRAGTGLGVPLDGAIPVTEAAEITKCVYECLQIRGKV